MKQQRIRGIPMGILILSSYLSALIVGFSIVSIWIMASQPMPPGVKVFVYLLIVPFLFLPGILYLIETVVSYLKQVIVLQNKLVFIHPFRRKQEIPLEEITYWGCAAFAPRSTVLYFCTADSDTLSQHLKKNRKLCLRIFGEARVALLESSEEGMLRLAVGTYVYSHLHRHRKDIFILHYCTTGRLKMLVKELKRDALITGPWLIDTLSAWETFAKYH